MNYQDMEQDPLYEKVLLICNEAIIERRINKLILFIENDLSYEWFERLKEEAYSIPNVFKYSLKYSSMENQFLAIIIKIMTRRNPSPILKSFKYKVFCNKNDIHYQYFLRLCFIAIIKVNESMSPPKFTIRYDFNGTINKIFERYEPEFEGYKEMKKLMLEYKLKK